jgi:acetyltransferase-like isoleucine patch superfamily enzyme
MKAGKFGGGTRVLHTGEIVNINGDPDKLIVGKNGAIGGQLLVFAHAGQIQIGDWFFIGENSRIWSSAGISIGNNVLISHGVEIHDTESHHFDADARSEQTRQILLHGHPRVIEGIKAAPIRIEDDVWIGFGATIRKGVTIGARSIIGARAIVDKDVPPGALVKVPATSGLRDKAS